MGIVAKVIPSPSRLSRTGSIPARAHAASSSNASRFSIALRTTSRCHRIASQMKRGVMNPIVRALIPVLLAVVAVSRPAAQMLKKDAPIRVGHYHLNVTSVADHKRFWVDTLGGTAGRFGNEDIVKFGDVVLFLHQ